MKGKLHLHAGLQSMSHFAQDLRCAQLKVKVPGYRASKEKNRRGTSREKIYAVLGWESLSSRRWSRRMTLFYKIMNNLTPLYTKEPIPPLHQLLYSLRSQDVIRRLGARTEKFQSSFIPTSYLNGTSLTLRLGMYHPLLYLSLSFYQ